MRLDRAWLVCLAAAALVLGCGGAEVRAGERVSGAFAPRPRHGVVSSITFSGEIDVDPRAGAEHAHGRVWLHVYYLDDVLMDSMSCYAEPDHCAVFDLDPGDDGQSWVATLAFSEAAGRPLVVRYGLDRDQGFRLSRTVDMQVFAAPLGEIGATRLHRVRDAAPMDDLRARLRAEGRLQAAYQRMADRFEDPPRGEHRLPAPRAEAPAPPPCGPIRVEDAESLEWLGLRSPVVLSWAYGLEVDEAAGTLRLTARRDPECDGRYQTIVLEARVDAYGDLERVRLGASPDTSAAP